MKSVEMWPFIGTKHTCPCAKEDYPKGSAFSDHSGGVMRMDRASWCRRSHLPILQGGNRDSWFGSNWVRAASNHWTAKVMGSQVYEPTGSNSPVDQAAFRTWPAICCIVQTAPQMAVFQESLPPWSERFASWSPAQKGCWKHISELAVGHFPQHKQSSTELCLSWLRGLYSLWILQLMMNSGQLQWWWADSWACLSLAGL